MKIKKLTVQETADDIITEMRGARTEFPFVYLMGEPDTPEVIDLRTKEITEPRKINIRRVTVKELADRFEAALKRECGNYAKLREALELCIKEKCEKCRDDLAMHGNHSQCISGCETVNRAKAALSAPPRNCDVGEAKAQIKRFVEYCKRYRIKITGNADVCNPKCPCRKGGDLNLCALAWAQMPYEEGGAK